MRKVFPALLIALSVLLQPALAVEPDEVLKDPALEARARALSKQLRCLVCQNQSIDDSDAKLAKDLRILLRERLLAGDSDTQAVNYLVDRFGEFVLLRPRIAPHTYILWFGPFILLLAGVFFLYRQRRTEKPDMKAEAPLTRAEQEALEKIVKEQADG